MVEQIGHEDSKAVATPEVEEAAIEVESDPQALLEPERASQFRALAARAKYISVDRADGH